MKKIIYGLLCLFLPCLLAAQDVKPPLQIEHGIAIGTRVNSHDEYSFQASNFGIELGYYGLKKIGVGGSLSIGVRLAYTQGERNYENAISLSSSFITSRDSVRTQRTGLLSYQDLALAIPIKFRYQFSQKHPFFLLLGTSPHFSLSHTINWAFDEVEYDSKNDIILSEQKNQEIDIEQDVYNKDLVIIGFGYKKDKLMVDLYLSIGSVGFKDDYIRGIDKSSIGLNAYYQLN